MKLGRSVLGRIAATAGLALLVSCNYHPLPPAQVVAQTPSAAATLELPTDAPTGTATPLPTHTPNPPTATETPSPSPQPSATPACSDSSQFVTDVTIPDNTVMKAGQQFTKTWRLRNSGDCSWTSAFAAVFVNGDRMNGPTAVPLAGSVPPNGTVDISVDLIAPTSNGAHQADYRLRDLNDDLFGIEFYVRILVGPTPTPSDSVYKSGKITIDNSASVDLDTGLSASGSSRDVWLHYVSDSERSLEPVDGALLTQMSSQPSRDQCKHASLDSSAINFSDFSTNAYFCYKTNQGRYGRFQVTKIETDSISFDYRTWR
jgi:hypothetical protein